jgi:PAS domain S-box-containing protein
MKNKDTARILIVDDQIHALQGVSRIMKGAGYQVLEASNGVDCLKLALEHKPDLILLDVVLPDIDGREVCRRIKSNPETKDIYLVLLSSIQVQSDSQAEGLEQGADGYIARPIPNRELLARVNSLLRLKYAKDQWRESEDRWQFALEGARDGLWDWNAQTSEVFFSSQWKAMFGYEEHEIGNTLDEWDRRVHPDDKEQCYADLKRHLSGETPFYENEHRVLCKDGTYKWILDRGKIIERTEDGKPLRVIGTHSDISERKRTEEALRESEERFRTMFERHDAIMLLIEPVTGRIIDANKSAEQFYGYTITQLRSMSIQEINILPPDKVENERNLALQECRNYFIFPHSLANGEVRTVEVHSSPIEQNGEPVLFSIIHDITDRKIAQDSLRESEQFLRQSEQINRIGGWKANPFTNTLHWTQGVYDILDAPKDYRPDLDAGLEFYTPAYRPIIKEAIAKTLEHGEPFKIEAEVITTGGKHRWTEVRGLKRVEEGEGPQIIGSFQDITERKLAEEALRETQENFRAFFETMDDIIIVGTPEGKIIYSNLAVSRKLGYTPEELKTMHVLDLHPVEKRQEAERIFAEMFRGERDACPLPLAKKGGDYLPVETRIWFGKWSGKDCIFGICKDLSSEQRALQKFNRLFDGNPTPIAVSSYPELKFTEVNDSFVYTLGFSREEVIGKTAEELGLLTETALFEQMVKKLQDRGSVRDIEMKVRKKDGTFVDGLFIGEIIDNQGQKSLLSVMVDISERNRLEREVKQAA